MSLASRRPVIVGVGEIRDRPALLEDSLDPVGLMAEAARRAEVDAGVRCLDRVESLDVMHQFSWRYDRTADAVCARLGIAPQRAVYQHAGGQEPLKAVHEAGLAIARGEISVALVVGGEAAYSAQKARGLGLDLGWPARAKAMENPIDLSRKLNPLSIAHGLAQPTYVYPLYENRCLFDLGQSPREAMTASAALLSRYARVASTNPYAWSRRFPQAEEIGATGPDNRMIAYPYPKLMVANPLVNQGAAVIVMSEGLALELGAEAQKLVYLTAGWAADEPSDYLLRDGYGASPAQDVVLDAANRHLEGATLSGVELYSCFPCVPKMAARRLDLGPTATPTVTGGLTFFGGPMNNYMSHAVCAMVRRLRLEPGSGLLYGQGDFVTKHHALALSTVKPEAALSEGYRLDALADDRRGETPPVVDVAVGEAALETFTSLFNRTGAVEKGVVVLRLPDGARTMARVPPSDLGTLAILHDAERSPIGVSGVVNRAEDGLLNWSAT